MKNRQVEAYKEALKVMEEAEVVYDGFGFSFWEYNGVEFAGVCTLLRVVPTLANCSLDQFMQDSKRVLGKEYLPRLKFWFTSLNKDEPKAKKERIEHLKKLIKLYEDEK